MSVRDIQECVLGIDPGVNGGLSVLSDGEVKCVKMPATDGDVLEKLADWRVSCLGGEMYAVIEQQTPRPTFLFDKVPKKFKGTILKSTCLLYGHYRMLQGLLTASGIPFEEATPQKWQKALGIRKREKGETDTKWKNHLKSIAQRLYPKLKITLATSDAVLLMEYARRRRMESCPK